MSKWIIGIDEAGRGPIAGPVAVGATAIPIRFRPRAKKIRGALKDSKKLTPRNRGDWYKYMKNHPKVSFVVAFSSSSVIDKINISNAANRAATKALKTILATDRRLLTHVNVYLDAGIKIDLQKITTPISLILSLKSLVRGDEKINAVKLASIAAKVERDRLMVRNHKKYLPYDFKANKGYGVKTHFSALKKHGPCPIHRLTFIKKYLTLNS